MIQHILYGGGLLLALLLPLAFNPFVAHPFEPVKVAVLQWIVAGMVVSMLGWAVRMAVTRAGRRPFLPDVSFSPLRMGNPLAVPVLIYLVVWLLATFVSVDPWQSVWGVGGNRGMLTGACLVLLFFCTTGALRTRAQIERLIAVLLLGSVPICLYGLLQFLGLDPLNWVTDSVSPVLSTLGRSNFLGAYLAVVFPFALQRLLTTRSHRQRIAATTILALQALCLLLTEARAAWLAFLFGASATLWFELTSTNAERAAHPLSTPVGFEWMGQHTRTACVLGIFCFVSVVIFTTYEQSNWRFLWMPVANYPSTVVNSLQPKRTEIRSTSIDRRSIIWHSTLPLAAARPLLGHGPETFAAVFNRRYPPGSLYSGTDILVDDPHNVFLAHVMATGFLGLAAFLYLVASALVLLLRLQRQSPPHRSFAAALLGALSAYLIQAQFNPDTIVLLVLFWLVLGMGAAQWRMMLGSPLSTATIHS